MNARSSLPKADIDINFMSWQRHMRATNLAPSTREIYLKGVRQFADFLAEQGHPQQLALIRRVHVEAFITALLDRTKPANAANRYRSLQQFFTWAVSEDEIAESPMARMRPPLVPDEPVPVLKPEQIRALVATCEHSTDFTSERSPRKRAMTLRIAARSTNGSHSSSPGTARG